MKPAQNTIIYDYLQGGGRITPLEALRTFGCLRLSARIHDLRKKGYDVKSTMITTDSGKRIAQYYLNSFCLPAQTRQK